MVKRVSFDKCLNFTDITLNFSSGLIVFTGISGSGKSILVNAILSAFGFCESEVGSVEIEFNKSVDLSVYGIETDDDTFSIKRVKNENIRYYIANQGVSKKLISSISKNFVYFLSEKEYEDFENKNLISIIDDYVKKIEGDDYSNLLDEYKSLYDRYIECNRKKQEYEKIAKESLDKKEFLEFEVSKIEKLAPKEGEEEELDKLKKDLSLKEKSIESINSANTIFDYESQVVTALDMIDVDSTFFTEAMNELKSQFVEAEDRFRDLEDMDIESLLDRIEGIGDLTRKYGSIKEALEALSSKKKELKKIDVADDTINSLKVEIGELGEKLSSISSSISNKRKENLSSINDDISRYSNLLSIYDAKLIIKESDINELGIDEVSLVMSGENSIKTFSKGELNRFRLVLIALTCRYSGNSGGVLFLDEIDANLSGEEAMKVAKVLKEISNSNYQIFSISHQPQLTSTAHQHFLVTKDKDKSLVKELSYHDKIEEIARMVSGNKITTEALDYAVRMLSGE